jgi:hypothetical protein
MVVGLIPPQAMTHIRRFTRDEPLAPPTLPPPRPGHPNLSTADVPTDSGPPDRSVTNRPVDDGSSHASTADGSANGGSNEPPSSNLAVNSPSQASPPAEHGDQLASPVRLLTVAVAIAPPTYVDRILTEVIQ